MDALCFILMAVLALFAGGYGFLTERKLRVVEGQLDELKESEEFQKSCEECRAELQQDYDELQARYEALRKSKAAEEAKSDQAEEDRRFAEKRLRSYEERMQRMSAEAKRKEWQLKWQLFQAAPEILDDYLSKGECQLWAALLVHNLRPDMDFVELGIVSPTVARRMQEKGIVTLGDVLLCDEKYLKVCVRGFGPATQQKLTEFLTANDLRQYGVNEKRDKLL